MSEFLVWVFHGLQGTFVEIWIVLLEVSQPAIQLPQSIIQALHETCPMATHPDSAEIALDRGTHLAETIELVRIPLRTDKEQVQFENLCVLEHSGHSNDVSASSHVTSLADGWEKRRLD